LIDPVLIGPAERIRSIAAGHGLDISTLPLIDEEGTFAAVARAAELAQRGKIDALMNGGLHICELLAVVVGQPGGIQPEGRISSCLIMDLPDDRDPLVIMASATNTPPTPDETAGIMQNAIDLADAMRFPEVRVAILSTMETVSSKVPQIADAGALRKSADCAGVIDAFDHAPWIPCDAERGSAAANDGTVRPAAKRANVLVVADLEVANLLVRSLSLLVDAHAAAVVLGVRVPIVVPSRAASPLSTHASCAVASLLADARRRRVQPVASTSMQPEREKTSRNDRLQTCTARKTAA
jgi:phosphate acetyltransferase